MPSGLYNFMGAREKRRRKVCTFDKLRTAVGDNEVCMYVHIYVGCSSLYTYVVPICSTGQWGGVRSGVQNVPLPCEKTRDESSNGKIAIRTNKMQLTFYVAHSRTAHCALCTATKGGGRVGHRDVSDTAHTLIIYPRGTPAN